ncbi:hypothetical protein PFNF54_04823 [Plasmodium falciparum NF54]|uniref:Erythrocyte membrane protein 1 n=1 Tax=Plasmodium falciparum (isolate NF54) TaxID=5843 RepID=W7JZ83_PLAFO|nr:hypothetical protein PFNF54_04823 [Plasmodium falciparum NF54]
MAPQGGSGDPQDDDAKNMFDRIGKDVYDEVHGEAKKYKEALKGKLQEAVSTSPELVAFTDPCELVKQYYNNHVNGKSNRYPCGNVKNAKNEKVKRFSDTLGGQCTDQQIEGNDRKNGGACAPYRRLYLCDKNLETISNYNSNARHKLLAEVCYAAKEEGDLIKTHYTEHKLTNLDTKSQLCTALARSFADIGDIVRGKDLFLGNSVESAQRIILENNLKTIFQQIHSEVTTTNGEAAEARYNDTKNYYQLREDWWDANRETVWKAITCNAWGNTYFRTTCSDGKSQSQANKYCRCDGDQPGHDKSKAGKANDDVNIVPTYFDYVPQYLRWFEEWAEDFCRKKKKKLKDVKRNCRDETVKYCSGNGYDCTKTIYKKGKLVIGSECTKCSVWCRLYEKWIDNQKKEFLKQRNKYETEISNSGSCGGSGGVKGSSRKTRAATIKYEGYESKFYKKLKEKNNYGTVDDFLKLLNKENECKGINEQEEIIDFSNKCDYRFDKNINNKGTFYHSEYCQPCPGCGVKRKDNQWKEKKNGDCDSDKHYKIEDGAKPIDINVLSFGDKGNEIKSKIDKFCLTQNGSAGGGGSGNASGSSGDCGGGNSDSSLCEPWKCYEAQYVKEDKKEDEEDEDEVKEEDYLKDAGGLCILKNKNKEEKKEKEKKSEEEPAEFQKTFNDFFYFWIRRFLNDSMYWRGKVERCLKNKSEKCKSGCNKDCDCFKKWIGKKKEEWDAIKKHFKTQEAFKNGGENGVIDMFGEAFRSADFVLELALELEQLFQDIKEGYGDVKELKGIENMLEKEKKKNEEETTVGNDSQKKTTIDKLLQHEGEEAKDCLEKQNDCNKQSPPTGGPGGAGGRSQTPHAGGATAPKKGDSEGEDEDEVEDGEESESEEKEKEEKEKEEDRKVKEEVKETKVDGESPKETTKEVNPCQIVDDLFKGTNKFSDACDLKYNKGKNYGWRCIPTGNTSNDNKGENSGNGALLQRSKRHTSESSADSAPSGDTTGGSICVPPRRRKLYLHKVDDGEFDDDKSLRDWFVKSAAVETFFLWDRYKKENKTQNTSQLLPITAPVSNSDDPQSKLQKSGEIPPDFLRQMFYTLGDYRDILYSGDTVNGGKENKIKTAIDNHFQKIREQSSSDNNLSPPHGTPGQPNSVKTPQQTWWKKYGEDIWNGMICALTYDTNTASGKTPTQIPEVKEKLWDSGKPQKNYQYSEVKLSDNDGDGTSAPVAQHASRDAPHTSTANGSISLADFTSRPTYFRYLEEWGETFCRQRTRMLAKIRGECVKSDGGRCSGDGLKCNEIVIDKEKIFGDFLCPTCAGHCRFYKKWIKIKKEEFTKQKERYETESDNAKSKSDDTSENEFVKKLEEYKSIDLFLGKLKAGPCSKTNNGDDDINFKENDSKTFKHTNLCDPCSEFKVKCNGDGCRGGANGNTCNKTTFKVPGDIGNKENLTEKVDMYVSDKYAKGFLQDLNDCNDAGIFKSIRKDVWKCGNVCGLDICSLKKINNNGQESDEHILIKELIKRWLEYFFQDYNRIQKKLKPCMNDGNESSCRNKCKKKCDCVGKWVEEKKNEWEKIKEHYVDKYNYKDTNNLNSFLETLIPQIPVVTDKGKHDSLDKLKTSLKCNCHGRSKKENDKNNDVIDCMIKKLQEKAKKCHDQHSDNPQEKCVDSTPLEDDEEDLLLEETENPVDPPKICGDMPTQPETKEEEVEKCEEASPAPKAPEPTQPADGGEQTPVLKPEEEAPPPAQAPDVAPPARAPADQPFDPTILQTTIPFEI